MNTVDMIRELRALQEKHKDDPVYTFQTRWSDVCRDVADRLEELNNLLEKAYEKIHQLESNNNVADESSTDASTKKYWRVRVQTNLANVYYGPLHEEECTRSLVLGDVADICITKISNNLFERVDSYKAVSWVQ